MTSLLLLAPLVLGDRGEVVGEGVGGIKAVAAHFVGVDCCVTSVAVEVLVVVAAVTYCRMSVCVRFFTRPVGAALTVFSFAAFFRCFAFSFFPPQFSALAFVDSICCLPCPLGIQ